MRFDVADLQLFLSVVEEGSLTRGAQALRLSLPSASERIGAMEDELGAQLLERTPAPPPLALRCARRALPLPRFAGTEDWCANVGDPPIAELRRVGCRQTDPPRPYSSICSDSASASSTSIPR
jgi:DNA-binding transcriptional LysR family regulator